MRLYGETRTLGVGAPISLSRMAVFPYSRRDLRQRTPSEVLLLLQNVDVGDVSIRLPIVESITDHE